LSDSLSQPTTRRVVSAQVAAVRHLEVAAGISESATRPTRLQTPSPDRFTGVSPGSQSPWWDEDPPVGVTASAAVGGGPG
jgi:hypothetical protein